MRDLALRMEHLEKLRKQDKKEHEEKLFQFKSSTNGEITQLKTKVDQLQQSEKECQVIKRKYNTIRKEQDNMMERERDLKQTIESLSSQNTRHQFEKQKLISEVRNATLMLQSAQRVIDEHKLCEGAIKKLTEEKNALEDRLKQKEAEVENFKTKLHSQADAFRSMESLLQQNIKHLETNTGKP